MFRLRRYRVFIAFAFIAVGLLYHFSSIANFQGSGAGSTEPLTPTGPSSDPQSQSSADEKSSEGVSEGDGTGATIAFPSKIASGHHDVKPITGDDAVELRDAPSATATIDVLDKGTKTAAIADSTTDAVVNPVGHPKFDSRPAATQNSSAALDEGPAEPKIDPHGAGGRMEIIAATGKPKIHWSPLPEHFPVPSDSLIALPTAKPKAIPKIQYDFKAEPSVEKTARERKLDSIKKTFLFSWNGYRSKAWLQDELSPESGRYRNPFCGWGATLVDTLDTLWIMGLKDEFEEAVEAVKEIDFTTSIRNDIPLFETVIRYLGGLVAAYDISGGDHKILLDKAVELAEVLIGAFDTPNRMPLTFYLWKPTFATQPHRARTRVVMAELGSLSVEFTRLAQITKEDKYYDAVARITNELELMQKTTRIPGLWPQTVDASGCKKPDRQKVDTFQPAGDTSGIEKPLGFTKSETKPSNTTTADEESSSTEEKGQSKTNLDKRELPDADATPNEKPAPTKQPDCEPQGLASPPYSMVETFGIGGQADSTYEYLPKEYLLLGGLEEKYKTMYELAAEAITERLLYRPMIPDESRSILLAGLVRTNGKDQSPNKYNKTTFTPEGTHLTCFAGGMYAIGSKIFKREDDFERAKKLTDGCVWAYESTTTGVMPEEFHMMPCQDMDKCPWNETQWIEELDPYYETREQQRQSQQQRLKEKAAQKAAKASQRAQRPRNTESAGPSATELSSKPASDREDDSASSNKSEGKSSATGETIHDSLSKASENKEESTSRLKKRQLEDLEDSAPPKSSVIPTSMPLDSFKQSAASTSAVKDAKDSQATESILSPSTIAASSVEPTSPPEPELEEPEEPEEPEVEEAPIPTREEYVANRIRNEHLPIGISRLNSKKYILRPEAIESVFIMYRTSGENYWREKGWKMFEAIQNHTKVEYGASAIGDVTSEEPYALDEMESFWLAETLKYFYLLFSEPSHLSLDDYVLNTEAHPFKRPKPT